MKTSIIKIATLMSPVLRGHSLLPKTFNGTSLSKKLDTQHNSYTYPHRSLQSACDYSFETATTPLYIKTATNPNNIFGCSNINELKNLDVSHKSCDDILNGSSDIQDQRVAFLSVLSADDQVTHESAVNSIIFFMCILSDPTSQPTMQPAPQPTPRPIPQPTSTDLMAPTPYSTPYPTYPPTYGPTYRPTPRPIPQPTPRPIPQPTMQPAPQPTPRPIPQPTPKPTLPPTSNPTSIPTGKPTSSPKTQLTSSPSAVQTNSEKNKESIKTGSTTLYIFASLSLVFTMRFIYKKLQKFRPAIMRFIYKKLQKFRPATKQKSRPASPTPISRSPQNNNQVNSTDSFFVSETQERLINEALFREMVEEISDESSDGEL